MKQPDPLHRSSDSPLEAAPGQLMSKAGSSLLRTTLVRAADNARRVDPQLARVYLQMAERGKDHLGALCVVAANLAERFWAVMNRQMPCVICNTDARPITPAEGKAIIADHWTVPVDSGPNAATRSWGPQQVHAAKAKSDARGAERRGNLRHHHRSARQPNPSTEELLDNRSP